jgi:serine/threonine protein kinase
MWDEFHLALDRDGEAREAYIVSRFGDQPEKLAELRALLAAHDDVSVEAVNHPARILEDLKKLDPENLVGEMIGDYRIQELIGEGGMGLVYAAEQLQPIRRRVALKIIKLGMDTREVIARFESERQALALMNHPNIARILGAGATDDGRPYFVMDFVPGVAITEYADQARLDIPTRLRLFLEVCEALHHAHQKGIIHRDLKPSNILVNGIDGGTTVKVIDFGVAKTLAQKLSDKTVYTRLGHFIGTPRYMSPEQAEMGALGVDTRADVYSLGVILFEMLTGRCPITREDLSAASSADYSTLIREKEVPRPSTLCQRGDEQVSAAATSRSTTTEALQRTLRGDLDWIVLKALAKERSARYSSVAEFAADIRRYFVDEPVVAKPPATSYRVAKFVRRHRVGVGLGTAFVVTLIAAVAGLSYGVIRANQALELAESEQQRSRASFDFLAGLLTRVVPDTARGEDARLLRSILEEASATLEATPLSDRRVVADLNQTLAQSYRALGDFEAAERHADRSLELWRSIAGDDSPPALRLENLRALVLLDRGDLAASERSLRSVLARQQSLLGRDHADSTATLNNLALVLMASGHSDEAMEIFNEVLAAQQAAADTNPDEMLRTQFNMAVLMNQTGRLPEAEALAREVDQTYRQTVGTRHPDSISARSLIASILVREGRAEEAQVVQRNAINDATETLGREHPDTIGLELIQGQIFAARGEPLAAAAVFRSVLAAAAPLAIDAASIELPAAIGLAESLELTGELDEAEQWLARADAIADASLPADHALRPILSARHGSALLAIDKPAEAIVKLTESYPVLRERLGSDNEQTRQALRDIVVAYDKLGQQELADRYRGEIFLSN